MSKKAIITGGSQGIGRETAVLLASKGYDVAFNYLSNDEMAHDTLMKMREYGGTYECHACDVRDLQALRQMTDGILERFGHVDLLVNNAGITKYLPFLEATEELWNDITYTDWRSSFFMSQWVARNMVQNGTRGVIINVTSIHQDTCFPHSNIYGPTKAALKRFTENAALELAPYGIRVLSIAPGCILIRDDQPQTPRARMLASRIPLGRMGDTAEVARVIAFLASDEASYMTGTCVHIDGGALLPTCLDNTFNIGEEEWNTPQIAREESDK